MRFAIQACMAPLYPYLTYLFIAWIVFFSCILMRVRAQFYFVRVYYLLIYLTCLFSSFNKVLIFLCIIFLTHIYVLSVAVLTLWVAPPEMFYHWYRL